MCLIKIDLPNPELQKNASPKTSPMNSRICSYSSYCHLKCLDKKPLKLSLYTALLEYFYAEKPSSLKRPVYFFETNKIHSVQFWGNWVKRLGERFLKQKLTCACFHVKLVQKPGMVGHVSALGFVKQSRSLGIACSTQQVAGYLGVSISKSKINKI